MRRQGVDAGGDELAEPVELAPRLPRVGLEARELEQRADAVVQARDIADDGAQLVAHALLVPVDVALEQVAHRRGERRERRLQLVGDGREQAGLETVGLSRSAAAVAARLQPLALQEGADHVAERRHQAGVAVGVGAPVSPGLHGQDARDAGRAAHRHVEAAVAGLVPRRPGRSELAW